LRWPKRAGLPDNDCRKNDMKNSPNVVPAPAPAEQPQPQEGPNTLVRFWACFFLCLAVLGFVSGLMLAGLFLLMGYKIF
jgi:hypothetical protein